MMARSSPVRILCFGASLVEGHTDSGMRYTPYSTWLLKALQEHYPGREFDMVTDGVSGDMVTGGYKGRMRRRCMCFDP